MILVPELLHPYLAGWLLSHLKLYVSFTFAVQEGAKKVITSNTINQRTSSCLNSSSFSAHAVHSCNC